MSNNFYSPADIADMLKVSYATALSWIKYSGVPYIKIGRTYRVSVAAFDDFISVTTLK